MRDVYDALSQVGWSANEVEVAFKVFGESTANLEDLMKRAGLSIEQVAGLVGKLKSEHLDLMDSIKKTREEFEYENSDAGKLGITIRDIQFALINLGWTNDDIARAFENLGDNADNVNSILEALGLTAEEINNILGKQTNAVERLAKGYKSLQEIANEAKESPALTGGTPKENISYLGTSPFAGTGRSAGWGEVRRISESEFTVGGKTYKIADWSKGQTSMSNPNDPMAGINFENAAYGARAFIPPEWLTTAFKSYQYGGPIIEDTLLMGIKSLKPYAMAHKGEYVSPTGPLVTITGNTFNVRRESDIDKIADALVTKIRLKTGLRM